MFNYVVCFQTQSAICLYMTTSTYDTFRVMQRSECYACVVVSHLWRWIV